MRTLCCWYAGSRCAGGGGCADPGEGPRENCPLPGRPFGPPICPGGPTGVGRRSSSSDDDAPCEWSCAGGLFGFGGSWRAVRGALYGIPPELVGLAVDHTAGFGEYEGEIEGALKVKVSVMVIAQLRSDWAGLARSSPVRVSSLGEVREEDPSARRGDYAG